MDSVVSQKYWNDVCENIAMVYKPHNIELKEVFDRHLKRGGTCFEVGSYPGRYLIYLSKRFGYSVSGIDATPLVLSLMPEHLKSHDVKVDNLYHGDFMTSNFKYKYDVVFSFGFIEHFLNLEEVIEKHVEIVKDDGILILACPNYRKIHYILRRILDPADLRRHVLDTMDLSIWKQILDKNGMEILEQGYYRTADFWVNTPIDNLFTKLASKYVERIAKAIDKRIKFPNKLLSPFLYSVTRKLSKCQ